jgi:hypothetical protein
MKPKALRLALVVTLFATLLTPLLDAQNVLLRRRLGNNSEGMTTIHAGPLNGTIAIMDGTDVIAFANGGQGRIPPRVLFSVLGLPINVGPRGIAYMDDEQRFIFDDPSGTTLTKMACSTASSGSPELATLCGCFRGKFPRGAASQGSKSCPCGRSLRA